MPIPAQCCSGLLLCMMLMACNTSPQVHFYTDAVHPDDVAGIAALLADNGYRVNLNDREVPLQFERSTLIHPILVQDFAVITRVAELLAQAGHPVQDISNQVIARHTYSTNHMGLYLIETPRTQRTEPDDHSQMPSTANLSGLYDGLCGDNEGQLNLFGNGVAVLVVWPWDDARNQIEDKLVWDGNWRATDSGLTLDLFESGVIEFDIVTVQRQESYGEYNGIRLQRRERTDDPIGAPLTSCNFIIEALS